MSDDQTTPDDLDTPLGHFDTAHLQQIRREMSPNIHDGSSYAQVVALLRSMISRELANPARIDRDKALAEKAAADAHQQAADALAAKHAAEQEAVVVVTPEERAAKEKADLDARQAREKADLDYQHEVADLNAQQAEEARQFQEHQAQQRAELVAKYAPKDGEQKPVDEPLPPPDQGAQPQPASMTFTQDQQPQPVTSRPPRPPLGPRGA